LLQITNLNHSAQQLLQLVLLHPPQAEEAVPPPLELGPVLKADITLSAFPPQEGQFMLLTVLLQSSSCFF